MGVKGRVTKKNLSVREKLVDGVKQITGLTISEDAAYALVALVFAVLLDSTVESENHHLSLNGIGHCEIVRAKHKYTPHGYNKWRDMGIPFMPTFRILFNDTFKKALVFKIFGIK